MSPDDTTPMKMSSFKLLPGSRFPEVSVADYKTGAPLSLSASGGRGKLVVFARGQNCPFCQATIKAVSDKISAVAGAGLDLVVAWADPVDVTATFVAAQGISPELAFGAGLKEADMRALGLYVSKPRGYWTQEYNFAEPAYFVLKPDNTIQYADIGSFPGGGRPNVDALLAAYGWAKQNAVEHPEFASVVWGSA